MQEARIVRRGPHPVVFRRLEVLRVQAITRHYVRVTVGGPALVGFHSEAPDDHVKLLFPEAGTLDLPTAEDGPPRFSAAQRARVRDFTPRRHDAERGELDLDFALHETGVASNWARAAVPGAVLGLGGPRGSLVVRYDFDWYLLVGDEAALPAIARRLEELPAGARVQVVLEVDAEEDEQPLCTSASAEITWLHRRAGSPSLERAVRELRLPNGEGFVFVAGESDAVTAIRHHCVEERKLPREWMRISGYWKRGTADFHD